MRDHSSIRRAASMSSDPLWIRTVASALTRGEGVSSNEK
jgi:hypothetical protein